VLELVPDPVHAIRWLDLLTASGEPAIHIDQDPPHPHPPPHPHLPPDLYLPPRDPNSPPPAPHSRPPDITVSQTATSPGDILLDGIAAQILILLAGSPLGSTARPPAVTNGQRGIFTDGPGNIAAALSAAGALPPASPVSGELTGRRIGPACPASRSAWCRCPGVRSDRR
jgi:hypothetical protein